MKNIEMQGSVLAPLKTSVHIDKLGKLTGMKYETQIVVSSASIFLKEYKFGMDTNFALVFQESSKFPLNKITF